MVQEVPVEAVVWVLPGRELCLHSAVVESWDSTHFVGVLEETQLFVESLH